MGHKFLLDDNDQVWKRGTDLEHCSRYEALLIIGKWLEILGKVHALPQDGTCQEYEKYLERIYNEHISFALNGRIF